MSVRETYSFFKFYVLMLFFRCVYTRRHFFSVVGRRVLCAFSSSWHRGSAEEVPASITSLSLLQWKGYEGGSTVGHLVFKMRDFFFLHKIMYSVCVLKKMSGTLLEPLF